MFLIDSWRALPIKIIADFENKGFQLIEIERFLQSVRIKLEIYDSGNFIKNERGGIVVKSV